MLADAEKPAGSHGAMAAGAAKRCGAEAAEAAEDVVGVEAVVETCASRTPSSCSWYQRTSQADRVVVKVEADTTKGKVKRSSRRKPRGTWHIRKKTHTWPHPQEDTHTATQDHTTTSVWTPEDSKLPGPQLNP